MAARKLALLALGLLIATPALAQETKPRDDAEMLMEVRADEEIAATSLLKSWAKTFNALVIPDPQIQGVKIRFLTNTDRPMLLNPAAGS